MRLHQEKVTPITQVINACVEEFVKQLRRDIPVTINLNELNAGSRAYVEFIAEQELAAQKRAATQGAWCFFCGSDSPDVKCECSYPESFRCAARRICRNCSRAHVKIGNHIAAMLKFPRSNRVNSRRYVWWKQIREAAETIEARSVADKTLDFADTLEVAIGLFPDAKEAWEVTGEELRSTVLSAFRKSKFVRFQELAVALDEQIQLSAINSAARLLKFLR